MIKGTKVKDVAVRKQLYEGGAAAVTAAKDPMIELARLIDAPARAARKVYETQDETKQQAYGDIAKARRRVYRFGRALRAVSRAQ